MMIPRVDDRGAPVVEVVAGVIARTPGVEAGVGLGVRVVRGRVVEGGGDDDAEKENPKEQKMLV